MIKQIRIYHNLRRSKSRETLNLLKKNGVESEVVLYLETPTDAATLRDLPRMLGMNSARESIRQKEDLYKELNLAGSSFSEEALIQATVDNPKLMERSIVVVNGKARTGCPPEQILEIVGQDVLRRQLEHIARCGACRVLSGLWILWIDFA